MAENSHSTGIPRIFCWLRRSFHGSRWTRAPVPEIITPLTTLALLRRIEEDPAALDAGARRTLEAEVKEIERRYFGPGETEEPDEKKLLRYLRTWLHRAAG